MDSKKYSSIPKKAISEPDIVSSIFFIIIVLVYVPNTLFESGQILFAFYLAPLAIVGLFLAENSGLALAKYNYNRVIGGNLFLPYLILVIIHIACICGCLVSELALIGYPIKACLDSCIETDITVTDLLVRYCIASAVLFLPAYCAIYQYRRWVLKYNIPNPNKN